MPYLCSNIPTKMFYSAYGAEILRTARTASDVNSFINHCRVLIKRMVKQGGVIDKMEKTLSRVFGRHFDVFKKFFPTSLEFCKAVLT